MNTKTLLEVKFRNVVISRAAVSTERIHRNFRKVEAFLKNTRPVHIVVVFLVIVWYRILLSRACTWWCWRMWLERWVFSVGLRLSVSWIGPRWLRIGLITLALAKLTVFSLYGFRSFNSLSVCSNIPCLSVFSSRKK